MTWLLAIFLFGCLLVPGVQTADVPADGQRAVAALGRIDFYRAQYGAPLLNMEERLAAMARDHTRDMIRRDYINTRSPNGDTLETRLRDARYPYPYRQAAQKVAVGVPTGVQLVGRWMTQRDSRRLILNREWREAGIGYAAIGHATTGGRGGNIRTAIDHYWVLTLAAPTQRATRQWRRDILDRVNRFRAQYHLAPLKLNDRLNRAAQAHADNMATRDYFAHASPDSETVGQRAIRAGYKWRSILENLAAGQDNPRTTVEGWIHSPGHREAMLNPTVRDAGVGYRFLSGDGGRMRQFHYWALKMARA
ncbi:MAG: CAP domain-containing protein [Alphaproteobacteria bacterium]|nr:CAP domain-containing protein [Alphaproteobacteria bacterium]